MIAIFKGAAHHNGLARAAFTPGPARNYEVRFDDETDWVSVNANSEYGAVQAYFDASGRKHGNIESKSGGLYQFLEADAPRSAFGLPESAKIALDLGARYIMMGDGGVVYSVDGKPLHAKAIRDIV